MFGVLAITYIVDKYDSQKRSFKSFPLYMLAY